jgi:hypothetical protein
MGPGHQESTVETTISRKPQYFVNVWRVQSARGWTLAACSSITAAKRELAKRAAQVKAEGATVATLGPCSREVRWPQAPSQTSLYLIERHQHEAAGPAFTVPIPPPADPHLSSGMQRIQRVAQDFTDAHPGYTPEDRAKEDNAARCLALLASPAGYYGLGAGCASEYHNRCLTTILEDNIVRDCACCATGHPGRRYVTLSTAPTPGAPLAAPTVACATCGKLDGPGVTLDYTATGWECLPCRLRRLDSTPKGPGHAHVPPVRDPHGLPGALHLRVPGLPGMQLRASTPADPQQPLRPDVNAPNPADEAERQAGLLATLRNEY